MKANLTATFLAIVALSVSAQAGTYSIYSSTSSNATIIAPAWVNITTFNTFHCSLSGSTSGVFPAPIAPSITNFLRWKVRWTGKAGEPVPTGVTSLVQRYGHGATSCFMDPTGTAFASQNTPWLNSTSVTNTGIPGIRQYGSAGTTTNALAADISVSVDSWVHIAGTTYEGTADFYPLLQGNAHITGGPGFGNAAILAEVQYRMVFVGGQRVNPDF
jgi:hypothetical protein